MATKLHLLSPLDWAVVMGMFAVTALMTWSHRSAHDTSVERLVAGRRLTLPVMVATLVATWYGDIFGVTQIAFEKGIYMFLTQGVCWYVAYVSFALFFAHRLRKSQALSLCDYVKRRHGSKAANFVGVAMLLMTLPLGCAMGGGVLLKLLWGFPLPLAMLAIVIVGAIFGHVGGFSGVVRSDVVQFLTMCGAVASVVLFSWIEFGGMPFLKSHLPPTHLSLASQTHWRAALVWIGIATSLTFLNPAFCQRCLAARNERTARWGILLSCLVWMVFDFCTLTGGLYARATFPQMDSVYAYFYYGLHLLPMGLKGFFIAGVFATILSTLDSFLLVASSVIADDLGLFGRFSVASRRRWSMVIVVALTVSVPFFFHLNVESMWLWADGLFSCSVLMPLLLGRVCGLSQRAFIGCGLVGGAGMALAKAFGGGIESFFIGHLCGLVAIGSIRTTRWINKMFSSSRTDHPLEMKPNSSPTEG